MFNCAERMIKGIVQDMPRLRTRRGSSGPPERTKEPQTVSKPSAVPKNEQRLGKAALLERAKAAQSGALFRPAPSDSAPPASKPDPPASVPRKVESPAAISEPASDSRKKATMSRTPSDTPPTAPVKPESEDVQAYQRLVSLGMPAHREGLKFEVEPRRKRGRPPGQKKSIPQWMRDAERIALRELKEESSVTSGHLPPRYTAANLTREEEQWISPLPMPMMMSTACPSSVQATPSEVWARWAPRFDLA